MPRWLWCVGVPAVGLGSRALAAHHNGWVNLGLNGLVYDWGIAIALGYAFARFTSARGLTRPLLEIAYFVFPVFWFFCLVTALSGSWVWATPATVAAIVVSLVLRDGATRRSATRAAAVG
jgi:hypothetical protein